MCPSITFVLLNYPTNSCCWTSSTHCSCDSILSCKRIRIICRKSSFWSPFINLIWIKSASIDCSSDSGFSNSRYLAVCFNRRIYSIIYSFPFWVIFLNLALSELTIFVCAFSISWFISSNCLGCTTAANFIIASKPAISNKRPVFWFSPRK